MIGGILTAGQGRLATAWPTPEQVPLLSENEVHVWVAHLDQPAPALDKLRFLLSEDEEDQAARFHFEIHRNRFIAGRGMLRCLLGEYANCSPAELRFRYGLAGKPALTFHSDIEFNVAHSHGALLLAFSRDPVGVDIEAVRTTPERSAIARGFFAEGEYERLKALPDSEQQLAFLKCWTRKEAFLKTAGTGITAGLKFFEVSFEPGQDPVCLRGGDPEGSLHHLEPATGYIGALHVRNIHPRLRCYHFQLAETKSAEN